MSFDFKCPHCNTNLEAQDDWVGLETVCPNCSQTITITSDSGQKTQEIKHQPPPYAKMQPASTADTEQIVSEQPPQKSLKIYLLLGILLPFCGAHDFYAGYTTKGIIKVAISLCTCCIFSFITSIWSIVDICTVREDAEGRPFAD